MHMSALPASSVAVHVTGVDTPSVNVNPDIGLHDTSTDPSMSSVAVGLNHDTWAVKDAMSRGQFIITGLSWSV